LAAEADEAAAFDDLAWCVLCDFLADEAFSAGAEAAAGAAVCANAKAATVDSRVAAMIDFMVFLDDFR
jgi:hypothetical protein